MAQAYTNVKAQKSPPKKAEAPQEEKVRLSDITLIPDWATTRPIDEATVTEYLAAIARKEVLPPVEIVDDGTTKWLWDGNHRIECARRLNGKAVRAHVRQGTLDDAVRLAAGANLSHGLRRSDATARAIIEWLKFNSASPFQKVAQAELAKIAKVTQGYVSRIIKEFLKRAEGGIEPDEQEQEEIPPEDRGNQKPDDSKAKNRTGVVKNPETIITCNTQNDGGACPEQALSKAESVKATRVASPVAKFPVVDEDGVEIPEHLKPIFYQVEDFERCANAVSAFKRMVTEMAKTVPAAWDRVSMGQLGALLDQVRAIFKLCRPSLVCPYCGAVDSGQCTACKGTGYLSDQQAHAAAKDLRNINRNKHNLPLLETR